jgi:hypothetical protein
MAAHFSDFFEWGGGQARRNPQNLIPLIRGLFPGLVTVSDKLDSG